MSVIWSGVTEEGAVVPVQVTDEGKVVAVGDGPQGDYLPITGGNLTGDLTLGTDKITLSVDGSAEFAGDVFTGDQITTYRPTTTASQYLYAGKSDFYGSGNLVAAIYGDGSASFAGDVKIGGTFSDAPNIMLNADGSAAFVGGNTTVGSKGNITVYRSTAANTNSLFKLDSDFGGSRNTVLDVTADGSATFAGNVTVLSKSDGLSYVDSRGYFQGMRQSGSDVCFIAGTGTSVNGTKNAQISADGSAVFSGDVVIGSRGDKWLIRESNGVAMLVQQSREAAPMSGVSPMIPEAVRDIPSELDLIEMALNEVMEKLRMTPPAGWPVWDGSDNP